MIRSRLKKMPELKFSSNPISSSYSKNKTVREIERRRRSRVYNFFGSRMNRYVKNMVYIILLIVFSSENEFNDKRFGSVLCLEKGKWNNCVLNNEYLNFERRGIIKK